MKTIPTLTNLSFPPRLWTTLFTFAILLGALFNSPAANVTMLTSDVAGATTSFNGALRWDDGPLAPSPANDYFIPNTLFMRTPTGTATLPFKGNSLTVQSGGAINMGHGALPFRITVTNFFLEGNARLVNIGNPLVLGMFGNTLTIGGGTSNTAPVWLYSASQATDSLALGYNITNLTGSPVIGFEIGRRPPLHPGSADFNGFYWFLGDNSGFKGDYWVYQDSKVGFISQNSVGLGSLLFTNFFPGVLKVPQIVCTNSFSFTNSVTVGADLALTIRSTNSAVLTSTGPWNYTNTLTIDGGGTYAIGSAAALPASPTFSLLNNSTLDVTATGLTLGGGANLTLAGRGTVKGTVTAGTGGILQPGGVAVLGNLTISNLTLTGGATNIVDFNAVTNDLILVTGNLSPSGVTVIKVATPPGNITIGTLYPIFKVTGTLGGTEANFSVDVSAVPQTFSVSNDTVNKIVYLKLLTSPLPKNLVWRGDVASGVNNAWAAGPLLNWLDGANLTNFAGGDIVSFTDAGATNQPTLNVAVNTSGMTVNSSSNYVINGTGEISGGGKLTKSGSGTLTLVTANSYLGGTLVDGGLLVASNATALGSATTASATVTNGASLDLVRARLDSATQFTVISGTGVSSTRGALSMSTGEASPIPITSPAGVRAVRLAGDAVIGGNGIGGLGTWSIGISGKGQDGASPDDLLGILDGQNHNLTKIGSDLLVLFATNASPVSQFTIVGTGGNNGGVMFQRVAGTPTLGANCPIVISNSAFIDTWDLQQPDALAGLTFANNFTIGAGGGQIRNTRGNFFRNANQDVYNGTFTLDGPLVLLNTSTYAVNGAGAIGLPWGKITINGVISGTNNILCNGPTLQFNGANHTIAFNGNNTYSGDTLVTNRVTLQISTASQGGGNFTVRDGSGLDVAFGNGQPTLPMASLTLGEFGGNILSFARVTSPSTTLPVINATNLIVNETFGSAAITPPSPTGLAIGNYPLIKYGAISGTGFGGFTLATPPRGLTANLADNPPTIDLQVTDVSGVLWTGASDSSWDTAGVNLNFNFGGPTAFLNNDYVVFNDTATLFTVNVTNAVTPAAMLVSNATDYVFTGAAGITGSANLVKKGTGSLTISNANTFTGGTVLNAGTMVFGNNTALGSGSLTVNGGVLAAVGGFRQPANSLIVGGDFQIGNGNGQTWGWPGTVNLGGATRTITASSFWQINGVVSSGGLSLVSPNVSQLQLTAANSYAGGTTVSNAILGVFNTSGSGTGSGSVTVKSTGILHGNGRIAGAVTFESGSFARLGTNGVLKLDSSLIIPGSATVQLVLSNNTTVGTNILATYNPVGSSGSFASTPVIASGSFAAGTQGTIVTTGSNVVLQVTAVVIPTILPVYVDGLNQLVVRINSQLGANYVLQSATNLTPPVVWSSVVTNSGTGGTLTNTVPVSTTPPEQFFRYQVQ